MKLNPSTDEYEIKKNLLNLMKICSSFMQKHSSQNPIRLEFSGLTHDFRYHSELIDHFYPLDTFFKKFVNENNQNKEVAKIFVSRADRNIRKSLITMTLFTLEVIIKIIVTNSKIPINEKSSTICKYIIAMKHFGVYSKENEDLVRILHYTRNTLHNGERVDREAHLKYKVHTFDFVRGQDIESTHWNNMTYLIQQLLDIFGQIIDSPKYVLK